MAKKETIIVALKKYQDDLTQGKLPNGVASVLNQYGEAEEALRRLGDTTLDHAEKAFSSSSIRFHDLRVLNTSARAGLRYLQRTRSLRSQPEYEIGVFARDHLLLKPDDSELSADEVEENRRRIERYKTEVESRK